MARYRLLIKASAARELEAVSRKTDRQRIVQRIKALADDPRPIACEKLAGYHHRYRLRQGTYRVVYLVDDAAMAVEIIKIAHRREVYR